MGFLNDTIRDARRPLNPANLLRRQMIDEIETESPEESPSTPGMQTVFRYQQANTLAAVTAAVTAVPAREFREASIQPVGESLLPSSDPLTAGEGPFEPASNVLNPDISVRGDRRTGNLVTGQEVSSSKVTAANVVPVSEVLQSDSSSGFSAPDPHRATQFPEIQAGSGTLVSPRANTPLSQPGRGASSEFFPVPTGESRLTGEPALAQSRRRQATHPGDLPSAFDQAAATLNPGQQNSPTASPASMAMPLLAHPTRRPAAPGISPQQATTASHPDRTRPSGARTTAQVSAPAAPAEPRLVIGRIDVLVVAPPAPASQAHAPTERGFLSRNYLKRL